MHFKNLLPVHVIGPVINLNLTIFFFKLGSSLNLGCRLLGPPFKTSVKIIR
eukprot:SAG31_NODE_27446_length_426_cov_0.605505_2_plen_50_part_01